MNHSHRSYKIFMDHIETNCPGYEFFSSYPGLYQFKLFVFQIKNIVGRYSVEQSKTNQNIGRNIPLP